MITRLETLVKLATNIEDQLNNNESLCEEARDSLLDCSIHLDDAIVALVKALHHTRACLED